MRIGIDLDNTLICYDHAFALVGKEEGFLPADFTGSKLAVKRKLVTEQPEGYLWESLQGLVYGRRIDRAVLFDGVARFLTLCRTRPEISVAIISHKTKFAHHDPQMTNLRAVALEWMRRQGFFDATGFGLDPRQVYLEGTRDEKVERINATACDLFIDDLPEVLRHAGMPASCRKILFAREAYDELERYASWNEICDAVFPVS